MRFGLLAQLVEQRTLNPWVAGSIPAQPTIFIQEKAAFLVAFLYLQAKFKSISIRFKILPGVLPFKQSTITL